MEEVKRFNLLMLGSGGVGKTSICSSFVTGKFNGKYDPNLEDVNEKQIQVERETYCLVLNDPSGAERFTSARDLKYKTSDGFVLIYSIVAKSTYNDLFDVWDQIVRIKDTQDFPCIVVGNKCDLEDERVVLKQEGQDLANKWNCPFVETSAKLMININQIFTELLEHNVRKEKKETKKGCVSF